MTPHEVKFALDRKLLALSGGGPVPPIMGVHSVVLVDGNTVCVLYDIMPDEAATDCSSSSSGRGGHPRRSLRFRRMAGGIGLRDGSLQLRGLAGSRSTGPRIGGHRLPGDYPGREAVWALPVAVPNR